MFDDLYFVHLGLLYCYVFSLDFNFDFLSTSQEIGWEGRLRYDMFSVEWALNLNSVKYIKCTRNILQLEIRFFDAHLLMLFQFV